jgi:hypothetical protein
MLTESILLITKPSKSGKFDVQTTVIVEGDMVTRNSYYTAVCATFDTVEAAIADCQRRNDNDETELGCMVTGPANFVKRIKAVVAARSFRALKALRLERKLAAQSNEVPF